MPVFKNHGASFESLTLYLRLWLIHPVKQHGGNRTARQNPLQHPHFVDPSAVPPHRHNNTSVSCPSRLPPEKVGEIKSPPRPTPQRSGGDRDGHPGSRRDEIDAAPPSFQTPPPRDHNDSPSSIMVAAGTGDEGKAEWPVYGGPPTPVAECLPRHPQEKEERKQKTASPAGRSDRRQGGEEDNNDAKRSGGSNSPEAGGGANFAAGGTAVEPGGGRPRRLNAQQTGKLSAAAAAIEAAAAAVAAIPVVGFSSALFSCNLSARNV